MKQMNEPSELESRSISGHLAKEHMRKIKEDNYKRNCFLSCRENFEV